MKRWQEERHAPAPGTSLCGVAEIAIGKVREFKFGGDSKFPFRMFIYNDAGELRAFMNVCPHFNVPLNYTTQDLFSSDGTQFMCMTHYAKFNFNDGLCTEGPCEGDSLQKIPLRIDGEQVFIA